MPKCDCCKRKFNALAREKTGKFCQTCHVRIFSIYEGRRSEFLWPEVQKFVPELDYPALMEESLNDLDLFLDRDLD